jgi:hypothetical protein
MKAVSLVKLAQGIILQPHMGLVFETTTRTHPETLNSSPTSSSDFQAVNTGICNWETKEVYLQYLLFCSDLQANFSSAYPKSRYWYWWILFDQAPIQNAFSEAIELVQ